MSQLDLHQFPDEDAVLSAADTARLLGVTKITLHRMRQREGCDGLPWVQVTPGRIGYMRRDVRAYLIARRRGALPEQRNLEAAKRNKSRRDRGSEGPLVAPARIATKPPSRRQASEMI